MAGRTVSESFFEEYLSKRNIVARYEELPCGITKPCDYSFEFAGQTLRFDIKEWTPKKTLLGVGSFDPYKPVREKINEGRKKFKQYKDRGEPCVLVLCHYGPQLIELDAISIFGAMYGDLGWMFSFNPNTGIRDTSCTETKFLASGSMIHQTPKGTERIQNTTISAVAVLKSIAVRSRRVGIALNRQKAATGHIFTLEETFTLWQKFYSEDHGIEIEPCLVVYDNLNAAITLPQAFPNGPYDERFGRRDDRLCRTYIGDERAAIENEETEVGIRPDDPLGLRS